MTSSQFELVKQSQAITSKRTAIFDKALNVLLGISIIALFACITL